MGLKMSDFELTESQLDQINLYFGEQNAGYAREKEDQACEISVTFTWVAGLGRFIEISYDSDVNGHQIEGFFGALS